ncbi:hypothetical protein NBRC111894_252 [Sporolactobacillus inulinus]|uniref:Uncharacterized protein n=1 Tax=Sporolactobacillus inulinus TaxID=2078 RepID=A0A4Y1Z702_9BACL|nr:hypothetical protein NBRC111894_252 [Sporolactobacillus inulinus]
MNPAIGHANPIYFGWELKLERKNETSNVLGLVVRLNH